MTAVQSYFVARKWLYRAVLVLVVLVVTAGVVELRGLVREMTPEKSPVQVLPSVRPENNVHGVATGNSPEKKAPETTGKPEGAGKTAKSEFFVEYRLERDRTRSQRIDMLRETVNNPNSPSEIRKEANQELMSVFRIIEKEMELENLIRAEGYKDAVVYLQEAEKTATVTVHTPSLAPENREKLVSLINRVTGLQRENIQFICKN